MYTDRGNVLYDMLLPLYDILLLIGTTRMLSFRSEPNTDSGFFVYESLNHGIRWKNLEAVLPSDRLWLVDDDRKGGSPVGVSKSSLV